MKIILAAVGASLVSAATGVPLPFPLPVNFSFGICDVDPAATLAIPGCSTEVQLASTISVRCAATAGCSTKCESSELYQSVLTRFAGRLGGMSGIVSSTVPASKSEDLPQSDEGNWWSLYDWNCNLHDLAGPGCPAGSSIEDCQKICENTTDCGGFLYYSKKSPATFALKNATCWQDIAPLPALDDGDVLYVLRDIPQPPPLPSSGGVLSAIDVCVTGDGSETLNSDTDESYELMG